MNYLLDTNVISELRKGPRAHAGVRAWQAQMSPESVYISVLVVGEIRRGIESLRSRNPVSAAHLDAWLEDIQTAFADKILPVDVRVAEQWGRWNARATLPTADGLIAATAKVHGLALVTRNTKDFIGLDLVVVDPFEG